MANTISPSREIHYISERKKLLVGRNNNQLSQLFKVDSQISDLYTFQIVAANNQIVQLSNNQTFKIYGSFIDAKSNLHVLFYTDSATVNTADNSFTFRIDTYNTSYMQFIKTNKEIDLTIVETTGGNTNVILRDRAIAYKRPYIQDVQPTEIVQQTIYVYNAPVTGSFSAGEDINLAPDITSFAFGEGLWTNTDNQLIIGSWNDKEDTTDKAFVIGNGTDESNRSNAFSIDLSGNVEAASITVNGSQVATNADLTGFATEEWVNEQGFLTEHQDLTAYATKEWVEGKNYLTGVNLEPYATKDQLSLSAANLSYQISQLALNIPTKTSDLTNDSGFITGYTAGSGISISNQNVISIDGELGKTYYADDTTLQLNEANNTFSVKSIRSKLNNGPGISLTEDGNGVVTITNTGGGGSGGYVYTAGTGLGLSAIESEAEDIADVITYYQFYVDEAWFNQHIDAYTSGLQNYEAGTGIAISNENVISVTGMVTEAEIADYATKNYVDEAVSGKADLSSVYTKEEVYTYIETDAKILEATSGKADLSAVQAVDDKFENYYTSAQVDEQISSAISSVPSTVYTGEDGIKVENGVISLTATIPSTVAQLEDAGNYVTDAELNGAISAFITSGDIPTEKTKLSQFNNDVGFITSTAIPDITGFATKTELSNTSTAIVAQIPDVTGFATEADLQIVSAAIPSVEGLATESELESVSGELTNALGNKANSADLENYVLTSSMSAYATSAWVIDQGYITGITDNALLSDIKTYTAGTGLKLEGNEFSLTAQIPSLDNYYNKTEVDTALALKANAADVYDKTNTYTKTEVNAISTALSSTVSGAGYLTEHQSLADYYTKSEVNTITGTLEGEITGKVAQSDFNSLCTAFSGAIDGKTTSGEVKTQIEAYGYQTATDVANAITGKADTATVNDQFTATSTYIDEVSGNLKTAIGTATNDMATQTWVGQQIADFITADDLSGLDNRLTAIEADYTTSGQVSSIVNTAIAQIPGAAEYDAGTGLQRVFDSNTNKYVFSLTGTILTGGTNIEVVGDAINFTGTIPTTVAELSDHANYVLTSSMSAYATSAWVTEQGYITGIANNALISDVTSAINEISGVISTDYALKTNVANEFTATSTYIDTVSGNLHNEIAGINIPTSLSQLTNDEGYISSLVFESQDDEFQDFSVSATSVYVDNNYFNISDNGNNQVYLSWKGVGIDGGVDGTEQFNAHWIYFDENFSVESDEDGASISLATTIPTNVSQLTNDSEFATSAYVTGQVNNLATGAVATNTADITVLKNVSGDFALKTELPTVPTNVGAFTNDAGYQTATDVTNAISASSGAIINGLATNDWVTNTVSSSLQTAINGKADSSIVTGIDNRVSANETAIQNIQTSGLATSGQASEIASGVVQDYIQTFNYASNTDLQAVSAYVSGLPTENTTYSDGNLIEISGDTNTINFTGTIPTVATLSADMYEATSGNIETQITSKNYITAQDIPAAPSTVYDKLSAGDNISLSKDDSTGITTISASGGGSTVDVDTICGMLSSANENLTISKADNKILFTATGGGGSDINIIGGPGIKVTVNGNNFIISIPSATITASGAEFTFDRRLINTATSSVVCEYNGEGVVSMSTSGTLPTGITTTTGVNTINFTATSANMVGNWNETVYVTFDAPDAATKTVPVQIHTIGYTSATLDVSTTRTFNFSANNTSTTSALTWTYNGSGLSVQFLNNTPDGIVTNVDVENSTLTFTGLGSLFTENGTTPLSVLFDAPDIEPQIIPVDIIISDVKSDKDLPLTFKSLENGSQIVLKNFGSNNINELYYNKNETGWSKFSADMIIQLNENEVLSLSSTQDRFSQGDSQYATLSSTGKIAVIGNINSLINNSSTFQTSYTYYKLFNNSQGLVDASRLILPSTGLRDNCYSNMFNGCTSLTGAPALPATTLSQGCYTSMFVGCSSLSTAPDLPATTLADSCYYGMFYNCPSLSYIKVGFSNWNGNMTTYYWVGNVAANGTFVCPTSLPQTRGNDNIPSGWTIETY